MRPGADQRLAHLCSWQPSPAGPACNFGDTKLVSYADSPRDTDQAHVPNGSEQPHPNRKHSRSTALSDRTPEPERDLRAFLTSRQDYASRSRPGGRADHATARTARSSQTDDGSEHDRGTSFERQGARVAQVKSRGRGHKRQDAVMASTQPESRQGAQHATGPGNLDEGLYDLMRDRSAGAFTHANDADRRNSVRHLAVRSQFSSFSCLNTYR